MKKVQLVAALMALLVYGCSEQMNPVEPSRVANADEASTMNRLVAAKTMLTASESIAPPVSNILSVSQPIVAGVGGNVRLQGSYLSKYGDIIDYDASLVVPAGALPYNATISISIDRSTFADDGTITFGPCGLVFKTPVKLTLHATNIDFVKKNQAIVFYYLNNGVMEPMPASYGSYAKKSGSNIIDAGAQVPHFSRYAFGR
jgi:hypothetical protein